MPNHGAEAPKQGGDRDSQTEPPSEDRPGRTRKQAGAHGRAIHCGSVSDGQKMHRENQPAQEREKAGKTSNDATERLAAARRGRRDNGIRGTSGPDSRWEKRGAYLASQENLGALPLALRHI